MSGTFPKMPVLMTWSLTWYYWKLVRPEEEKPMQVKVTVEDGGSAPQ